jgi:hypothetical protein
VAELEPIHLLDKLAEHSGFYTGIFFTYGADLAFFEEVVLYPLWRNGCRNNLVFMDAQRYADTIGDLRGSVTWVGRRYLLVPVDLGVLQSFHPKLVLLLGAERGRLLIGSGNLTFTGFGHNNEVFTCLDWTPDDSRLQHLFTQTWNMVNIVLQRWGHSDEAWTMLHKAAHVSDWLTLPAEPTPEVQLFHTLEEPLIDQCSRALSGEASDRITVLSPFLDNAALALSEIYSRLRPGKLCLVLQDQRTVGNVEALKNLCQAGVPLEIHRFNDDNRYLHAKIYIFDAADASYVLTGSANCTRAAWLTTCADGNFEIALLRRADSQQYFDPLLEARVAPHAIVSFDEISVKQEHLPPPDGEEVSVRLLDVSVRHDMLSVSCLINSLPESVTDLWLRLSTTPPHRIALGRHRPDLHTFQKPVPQELQAALRRPLSASVWGTNVAGEPVDLHCNELWMTNADELRREISRALPADVRTGGYLAEMALSSEEEWRDLFESLARLLELDVTGLKRRGGTYTASPPIKRPKPQKDAEGREIEIRLVTEAEEAAEREEVATALFQESPLHAWLEYVCGRLPGAAPEPSKSDDKPRKPDADVISRGKQHRRRWTPPERLGRRFVNLVDKYIRSLTNVEYMQTISTLHIPCYYSVFQRIVRLLLQHAVITPESFVQLAAKINRGFFGAPDDNPPVLCPCLRQHLQRVWHDEWRAAEVTFYALASVVLSERPGIGSLKSESENEELAAQMHEIREQNLRVLCGIASVMGIEWVRSDIEVLAQQAGEVYGLDGDAFACQSMDYLEHSLSSMDTVLDEWILKASIRLGEIDDPHMEALLRRARVDYALARYDVLAYLQDTDAQAQLCSDLIFWLRCAGDPSAAREWSEHLVNLLQSQGKSHKAARAMFHQGRALFFDREYHQAANILRQAFLLAERLGDSSLSAQCEQFLGHTGFFLQ